MNPKPFSSLNHLTVPVAMVFLHDRVPRTAEATNRERGAPTH
jgi:hypothetical protein